MEKEMRELYIEGVAIHGGPESWKAPDNRHGRREWKSPTSKI
jgi:hypothetical protein